MRPWILFALIAFMGLAGCDVKTRGPHGGGVDVEVKKTPDLNPKTDNDVDINVTGPRGRDVKVDVDRAPGGVDVDVKK